MIRITITTMEGEVLDQFALDFTDKQKQRHGLSPAPRVPILRLADSIRDLLEQIFEVREVP
jgi:hypothetical protein